jgi:hypothetical protein
VFQIFFFKAEVNYSKLTDLSPTSISVDKPGADSLVEELKWLDRDSLGTVLAPRKYLNSVRVLVPTED